MIYRGSARLLGFSLAMALARPAAAQVDQTRAAEWFREAAAACRREGGKLWGKSLCGPMVIADPVTKTIAASQAVPDAPRPAILGFANAAIRWGDVRWSTFVWQMMPADSNERIQLVLHELFHRIQPDLGLFLPEPDNGHLESLEGRYWIQLEWRALARALGSAGSAGRDALGDAQAFRAERQRRFPEAAENERVLEINEGLAQYTGIAAWALSNADARSAAILQLQRAAAHDSFLRNFAYGSGAAYGILLDAAAPGWSRRFTPKDTLSALLAATTGIAASPDPTGAARRYDGATLRLAEEKRETARLERLADYTRRFVEGPVLILPSARTASFTNNGMMPIPGHGTIYPTYRTTAEWGRFEAAYVLMSADRSRLTVPAPASIAGITLSGDGWTLTVGEGWGIRPGPRAGDYILVRVGADTTGVGR